MPERNYCCKSCGGEFKKSFFDDIKKSDDERQCRFCDQRVELLALVKDQNEKLAVIEKTVKEGKNNNPTSTAATNYNFTKAVDGIRHSNENLHREIEKLKITVIKKETQIDRLEGHLLEIEELFNTFTRDLRDEIDTFKTKTCQRNDVTSKNLERVSNLVLKTLRLDEESSKQRCQDRASADVDVGRLSLGGGAIPKRLGVGAPPNQQRTSTPYKDALLNNNTRAASNAAAVMPPHGSTTNLQSSREARVPTNGPTETRGDMGVMHRGMRPNNNRMGPNGSKPNRVGSNRAGSNRAGPNPNRVGPNRGGPNRVAPGREGDAQPASENNAMTGTNDGFQTVKNRRNRNPNYRENNVDSCFGKVKKIQNETETVLIGDSIVRRQEREFRGRNKERRRVLCFPGINVQRLCGEAEKLQLKDKNSLVIVHVGTNDIRKTRSEALLDQYKNLIGVLKTKTNNIIVSSILPRIYENDVNYSKVTYINRALKTMCYNNGVTYMDVFPHFVNQKNMFTKDGIHPNDLGNARFGRLLHDATKQFYAQSLNERVGSLQRIT